MASRSSSTKPRAGRQRARSSSSPNDEALLARVFFDNPELRRAVEASPETRQCLVAALRRQHEALAAAGQESARIVEDMHREWESLPQSERDSLYEHALRAATELDTQLTLIGQDWDTTRSTDRLPPHVTAPVFKFILQHRDTIRDNVPITQQDIDDVARGLSIPITSFQHVIRYINLSERLATPDKIGNCDVVSSSVPLAAKIVDAWRDAKLSASSLGISTKQLRHLADIAAELALNTLTSPASAATDGKLVDPITGLTVPPDPRRPYRERGHHADGTRVGLFEFLRQEYGPYLDAHLLYSGHLQDIDRPAYEALLYLARKYVRHNKLDNDVKHTAAFFLQNGILAGEHLEYPPQHLVRQVNLINASRALSIVPRIRGRKSASSTPIPDDERQPD